MTLLKQLNRNYLEIHLAKEQAFWKEKMGLKAYQKGEFEKAEKKYKSWISNPQYLSKIRQELRSDHLTKEEREGLQGWLKFFKVHAMEDPEARVIQDELIQLENSLESARSRMSLGYIDPKSNDFVSASFGELSLMIITAKDENLRKAAWQGKNEIASFVLDNGFIEVIKKRNQLAHKLGYEDYYDYKVQLNEGFSKQDLFKILDDLATRTEEACRLSMEEAKDVLGEGVLEGWNFHHLTSGDLTKELDQYFSFDNAFENWVRSFAALNINFQGATIQLDLLDRKGKYHNGFMHGPVPSYYEDGQFQPAQLNFTANAIPNKVGSGLEATGTLFHEGGHAAHFSNIKKPAPCFSQEFAPTSVAFAETQSMFLDSLIDDPDWQYAYAKGKNGSSIPFSLIEKKMFLKHRFFSKSLRGQLAICYFERELYEMPDEELTADHILQRAQFWGQKMHCMKSIYLPLLCIPHIISSEASAYCHGYVLAYMAVYQTRDYFMEKYGYILDNPKVGQDLAKNYWHEGNESDFITMVEGLTKKPFNGDAIVNFINKSKDELIHNAKSAIENYKNRGLSKPSFDLGGILKLVDGDKIISNSEDRKLEEMVQDFKEYVSEKFPAAQ